MDIVSLLSRRINLPEVRRIASLCADDVATREMLWQSIYAADRRVSVNALWILTHFDVSERDWIVAHRDELIDFLLSATDVAKKRMLLQLLRDMDYGPEDICTDLLDYCLTKINSESEPYAVRAFSIYLAFKMCRHYPELIAELEEYLSMLSQQSMSPGLISARNTTIKSIKKTVKSFDSEVS